MLEREETGRERASRLARVKHYFEKKRNGYTPVKKVRVYEFRYIGQKELIVLLWLDNNGTGPATKELKFPVGWEPPTEGDNNA